MKNLSRLLSGLAVAVMLATCITGCDNAPKAASSGQPLDVNQMNKMNEQMKGSDGKAPMPK